MRRFHPTRAAAIAAALLAPAVALGAQGDLPVRTVSTAPVSTGDVVDAVELVGELQGIEEVRIFAQVPERIRKLAVKEGDRVKAGDLLVAVAGDVQSQTWMQAQAGLDAALVQRDAVADNLKRTRALAQTGSIPMSQLEQVEVQVRAAEAAVRQATAAVGLASAQKARVLITSPIDGVVSAVSLKEGDLASPGVPILTVVRPDRLRAVLRVPERHFLRVAAGMPVRFSPLARPDVVVESTVTVRGSVIDRMTRTGLVEVHLDNQDGKLVAGSTIKATIELSRKRGAVLVPASALLLTAETERTGQAIAFVAEGETARRREVKIGRRQGGSLEILEGLEAGEPLIVQGAHLLRDNNPIRVAAAGAGKKEAAP